MDHEKTIINDLKKQGSLDINQVVQWCNRLLPHFAPAQKRHKVSDKVSVRIVRYYMNRELISRPISYQGRNALFSPTHVIQILAIKSLQAQYVPLKKIAQIMGSASEAELTAWLLDQRQGAAPEPPPSPVTALVDPLASGQVAPRQTWERFSISGEVELFLKNGYNLMDHPLESGEVLSRILQALTKADQPARREAAEGLQGFMPGAPARAIKDPSRAVIALATEGGLVPVGNPDGLPTARSRHYLRYNLDQMDDLLEGQFESVDRGWDNTYVNQDPDRLLPLDVMRELESLDTFDHLHQYFFSTTGVGTTVENARLMGLELAREIKQTGITAVIFTAT